MPEQPTRLAEIEARAAAATDGTWGTDYDGATYYVAADIRLTSTGTTCSRQIAELHDDPDDKTQTYRDATFIARARKDVPWLLDQLEQARRIAVALEQENAQLEADLKQIRHLHKDSPMGPCPVCFNGDDHVAGGDGLVPYPCPTARLAGATDCDPPTRAT